MRIKEIKMIPHNKPTITSEDINSVTTTLKSNWLSPGAVVEQFESDLSTYLLKNGNGSTIAVDSGTSALHLALMALGIQKGDEVILPTYVCTAVLNAINYTGAIPVLVDINPDDFNISYEDTFKKLTPKTKVIIIPHIYGVPVDIRKFVNLGIPIIEDCAQSIGAKINNQMVGTFGDIAIFSFYATKLLTTARGGAVFSKNQMYTEKIWDLVDFDYRKKYDIRYNYRMSDYQAALGLSQLKNLEMFIKKRNDIADLYFETLKGIQGIYTLKIPTNQRNIWYRYIIMSEQDPNKIINKFSEFGVTVINPLENWELLHNYLHQNKKMYKNAENITQKTISVPIFPSLSENEIQTIRNSLIQVYG